MQLFPTLDQTIHGVAPKLRDGQLSCAEVVETCLARIDERDAEVQAWVSVDREGALNRAHQLDQDAAAGRWHGALHGIPLGIKDIVDVAGVPTAAGSELLTQQPAQSDALLVSQLRAAGAIILGKTVTTQFAAFDPPVTRNPWNLDHTPGGSSSGSAAAVATGMCLGAIGSQTGGSITRPAAFCGIAGCKPTFGLVSTHGVFPFAPHLDHPGPMARSVRDVGMMLDALAVPNVASGGQAEPPHPVCDTLDAGTIDAPTIGRLRGFFETMCEPSTSQVFDDMMGMFSVAGATVAEKTLPPSFADLHRCHRVVMVAEAAALHEARLAAYADDYKPGILSLLEEGLKTPAAEYFRCRRHQELAQQEILGCFNNVDVLVCPAALGAAPDTTTTGDPAFNSPWSYTGLPTVSFPLGLSAEGLPLGIQFVGRPYAEPQLFRAAAWCEDVVSLSVGI